MNRRSFFLASLLATVPLTLGIDGLVFAKSFTGQTSGIAINGYDPVAYFTQGKPVKGSAEFSAPWNGVMMHFSSATNRDLFLGNPSKYAPKYGGYCAYAAAKGQLAPTVPEAFSIVEGRLYLNYSTGVKSRWDANQTRFIKDADQNWPKLK